jgi:ubiquinone/menaquinone biosynthesis C-methylase UbiE
MLVTTRTRTRASSQSAGSHVGHTACVPKALRHALRDGVPLAFLTVGLVTRGRARRGAFAALAAVWAAAYARYRRNSRLATAEEYTLLGTATREAYARHYNERVPTIEEEFEIWGRYHQHRHEMRYDLVAAEASKHIRDGGVVLDLGCGSALVADRMNHREITYIGLDYGGHHIRYAAKKYAERTDPLRSHFVNGAAEQLPVRDAGVDLVVFTEVIEHLVRPELAVWEIARVLRPGGWLVLTTNNASQMPLSPPTTNPLAWLEKGLGAHREGLISHRPWIWPDAVDRELLPPGSPPVYLPHTWHIQAETRRLLATAGLVVTTFSTFEFPPPESATAQRLEARGASGQRAVDVIESICRAIPIVNRLGAHLLLVAEKRSEPPASIPPGVWAGPFSEPAA